MHRKITKKIMSDVNAEVHLCVTVSDCSWAVVVILFTSIHCWVVCWCGLVRTICFTARVTNASWRQTSQIRLLKRRMKRTLLTVTVWSSWSSHHIPVHCLTTVTKPFRTEPFISQHLLFFALVVRGLRLIRMAMHVVLNNSSWPPLAWIPTILMFVRATLIQSTSLLYTLWNDLVQFV